MTHDDHAAVIEWLRGFGLHELARVVEADAAATKPIAVRFDDDKIFVVPGHRRFTDAYRAAGMKVEG